MNTSLNLFLVLCFLVSVGGCKTFSGVRESIRDAQPHAMEAPGMVSRLVERSPGAGADPVERGLMLFGALACVAGIFARSPSIAVSGLLTITLAVALGQVWFGYLPLILAVMIGVWKGSKWWGKRTGTEQIESTYKEEESHDGNTR